MSSSISQLMRRRFTDGLRRDNFCYVSLRNRIKELATRVEQWGGDDVMYQFSDGSKLIERRLVREFKILKE